MQEGPKYYMAPGVGNSASYDCSSDMWSLGVVLLDCMNGLPKGFLDEDMSGWHSKVVERFDQYNAYQSTVGRKPHGPSFAILQLVFNGMLSEDPDYRMSAQKRYDKYAHVWRLERGRNTKRGGTAPTEAHPSEAYPDGSFEPSSLELSKDDMADGGTVLLFSSFNTSDQNDEGTLRSEDLASKIQRTPPVDAGALDVPASVDDYPFVIEADFTDSYESEKRKRHSRSSSNSDDEDKTITPGGKNRRAAIGNPPATALSSPFSREPKRSNLASMKSLQIENQGSIHGWFC